MDDESVEIFQLTDEGKNFVDRVVMAYRAGIDMDEIAIEMHADPYEMLLLLALHTLETWEL